MPPSCALLGEFAIGARVALLWQHYENAWQSPAVIRQAHCTPHALLNSNTSSTCPANMGTSFALLMAEICWQLWGTPANFNGFRVMAALLHGTLVVGVSQTLRH